MKNIILVFGTRPEAIKMCPLVTELKKRKEFCVRVLVTGQHREMLSSVLSFFGIEPDFDLCVMSEGQTLFDITEKVMRGVREILEKEKCDLLLVHGDTTTAFAASLAAFYLRVPVGHVEAGLRTYNINAPYPEEFNRVAVDSLSYCHFAPTKLSADRLIAEGRGQDSVFVTGNTVIDALRYTVRKEFSHPALDFANGRRMVLLTSHRRENIGETMQEMFAAIKEVLLSHPDVCVIYPVHPNPAVRAAAQGAFAHFSQVKLTEPLDVFDFHNIMARAYLVLSDSGGVQEEAPAFGVPVLVMRETTERPEGVEAGTVRLIGNTYASVKEGFEALLDDAALYESMAKAKNPYGDGTACKKIADIIEDM
ncbi:MAG: UDP-N-acetylglucosamine 2-epimerase (non-hydrolyzing) [Ruminococcaceae bacterium]|nr:UDP-N-acetylglucosamine 2-epimerase (non-hydrolyzing) [Oscillospiraceae bacterium]